MVVLNHLLWLKARLAGRTRTSGSAGVLAVVGILLGVGLAAGFGVSALCWIVSAGPQDGRVVAAGLMAGLYGWWLLAPTIGYRLNDGLDQSLLAHFPVRDSVLTLGTFLGNFLDPAILASVPALASVIVAGALLGGDPLLGIVAGVLFLFHAMGTAQVGYLVLVGFLGRRRVGDVLLVVFPLVAIGLTWGLQYGVVQGADEIATMTPAEIARRFEWLVPVVLWTPPGLVLEAAMPPGPWSVFGPGQACLLLAGVAGATVLVAARASHRTLAEGGGTGGATGHPGGDRLFRFFHALVPSARVAARAAAELRLLVREPQYVLMYVIYLALFVPAMIWGGREGDAEQAARILVPILLFSSIFVVFTGIVFNAFAVERGGLRFAFSAPVDPLVYLVGKNLGSWLPMAVTHGFGVAVATLAIGLGLFEVVLYLAIGQLAIVVLLGFGNLASSLAPQPLPSLGAVPAGRLTFAQVFQTGLVVSAGMALASAAAWAGCGLVAMVPVVFFKPRLSVFLALLGLAWTAGIYGGSTVLAAHMMVRRREQLLDVLG